MKLFFDQNLSFSLCERLSDLFPPPRHRPALSDWILCLMTRFGISLAIMASFW